MSADGARPWWATADPDATDLDPDEDPIDALRAARHRDGSDPAGGQHDAPSATEPHPASVCGICPLCAGWRLLSELRPEAAEHLAAAGRHLADARPEVAEHLAAAGRHLASAVRHLVDEVEAEPGPDQTPFQRIDVDVDDGGEPSR